ncbi:MAG: helix-turn-helix transcriptional regulator [Pelotomaculum sp.]|nr:helix-turn-helix transcriptional regulator [Pelotomaculum sp.]
MIRKVVNELKTIRVNKKITHDKLSGITRISQKHISNIENHKTIPSIETLQKLARGLGVKIRIEILDESNSKVVGE